MEWDSFEKTGFGIVVNRTQSRMDRASMKNLVRNNIEKVVRSSMNCTSSVDR